MPLFIDATGIEVDGQLFQWARRDYHGHRGYWLHATFLGGLWSAGQLQPGGGRVTLNWRKLLDWTARAGAGGHAGVAASRRRNADFAAAMEWVLDVYRRPYDAAFPLVCMDETPQRILHTQGRAGRHSGDRTDSRGEHHRPGGPPRRPLGTSGPFPEHPADVRHRRACRA